MYPCRRFPRTVVVRLAGAQFMEETILPRTNTVHDVHCRIPAGFGWLGLSYRKSDRHVFQMIMVRPRNTLCTIQQLDLHAGSTLPSGKASHILASWQSPRTRRKRVWLLDVFVIGPGLGPTNQSILTPYTSGAAETRLTLSPDDQREQYTLRMRYPIGDHDPTCPL